MNRTEHNLGIASLDGRYPRRTEWLQNGFPNRTASSLAWSNADRRLTINPTGTSFNYFVEGVKYTVATSDVINVNRVDIADTEGLHLFYYDGATLTTIANPTDAQIETATLTKTLVAYVYWDADNNLGELIEDRHGLSISPYSHSLHHFTEGTMYFDGLALGDFVISDGVDNEDAQFSVATGQIFDEDIKLTLNAIGKTTGLEVWYRNVALDWRKGTQAGFSVLNATNGRVYYDNAGTLTEVTDGKFVLYHIFATNNSDLNPIAIMGQTIYLTGAAARIGATTEINSLLLGALPAKEMKAIATVIFQTKDTYTNDVKAKVVQTDEGDDYVDWRTAKLSPSAAAQDHGSLSGLADDDHPQYVLTSFLGIGSLADPDADTIIGWDDTDGATKFITIGANLSYDHATHTLSATGGYVSDTEYGESWDGVTNVAPSKNAIYDKIEALAGGHNAVTLDVNAETLLSLSTQELGLDTQTANKIFAGPASGAVAVPTFRSLVADDIPDLSAVYAVVLGADDNYVTDAEKTNIGNLDTAAYEPTASFAAALGADDNYVTDVEKAALHAAVTVTDSDRIDFTLTGQDITADIKTGSVTLAMMANMATASLIYRKTAEAGVPEVNTLATLKTDLGLTGTNSGDQTIASLGLDADLATFALPASTTISAFGATIIDDANAAAVIATLGLADIYLALAGGTMAGNITLGENTAVALDPAGSADEKWSGITCTGTAGATLAVGDLIYLDVTAGEWLLADADAASTSGDVPLGLCILAAGNGQATNILLIGTMRSAAFPASIALGAPVYVSTTAGDIQAAQPSATDDVIRRVGWAVTVEPNTIYFNPSNDYITHT